MAKIVPEAVYLVLNDHPEGLTVKQITEEIKSRNLYTFGAKEPSQIVARAINRHCKTVERVYSCAEKYFTSSKDSTGAILYKNIPNAYEVESLSKNFVYPKRQISIINNSDVSYDNGKNKFMDVENLTVREILDKYCFFVPDYQRSYSWKTSQVEELLDDLFNIIHSDNDNARHFLGAITLTPHGKIKGDVDLIDGQQRITTLFIVLYVILYELSTDRFKEESQKRVAGLLQKLAFYNDDGERVKDRLTLNAFNQCFFEEYVINTYEKTDEDREKIRKEYKSKHEYNQNQSIFESYNRIKIVIEEHLECCKTEEEAYEYLKAIHTCILNRLEIVVMSVNEEADAFLIFETLNDRGLVLSAVDLIKNKLFQAVSGNKTEFEKMKKSWEKMCEQIENKDNLKKYLLHYWRSKFGFVSLNNLYKTCRDYISNADISECMTIVNELERYSQYYNGIYDSLGEHPWTNKELKDTLYDMSKLGYDLTHPVILSAIRKYPNDEVAIAKIAKLCLNFLVRYISVLKKKPTSIEKELSKWACSEEFSIEMLKEKFEEEAPSSKFAEALINISVPYQSPLAHYLLCVYEAYGFDRNEEWQTLGRWNNTIEHVLPQDVNPDNPYGHYWISQFGTTENCDLYLERLGNYAFLTQTAQSHAKNKDFHSKKLVYETESDMLLTKELLSFEEWNAENIQERQNRMAKILTEAISFDC